MLRFAIALSICLITSISHAGFLYRGNCFTTAELAVSRYVSDITGHIFQDGTTLKYRYHYDIYPGQYYVEWTKFSQNTAPVENYSHVEFLTCDDNMPLNEFMQYSGLNSASISIAIGIGFALVFSLAFLGYGLGIVLRLIRRI